MLTRRILLLATLIGATSLVSGASALPADGGDPLNVVTTIPDLADIVREVGGDEVKVRCVAKGRENLHSVRLRPSHLVMTARADLFVQVGLALEHGWVPGLLESARNSKIMRDGPLNVGTGWPKLVEIPVTLDRRAGVDIHPLGNPHINMHPDFGSFAGRKIRDRLKAMRPEQAGKFDKNLAAYEKRIAAHRKRWAEAAKLLKGRKVVQYHKEFSYLCGANGILMVGALEPQPGVPPTPGHLAQITKGMRELGVTVILHGPWTPGRVAEDAAKRAGAKAVELPVMTQRDGGTWLGFMDRLHEGLLGAWDLELEEREDQD